MGIVFGRLWKKPTTFEQLEKLDMQIKTIEEYGKSTEITQRRVAGRFLFVSVVIYVVASLVFYFYFFPPTVYERLLYVIPLIAAPLVIVSVKRLLTWWYNKKLKRNHNKLSTLKEKKKKMLDNVMETETYKVAKKILEKFAPDEVIIRRSPNASFNTTNLDTPLASSRPGALGLRYRALTQNTGRGSLGSVLDPIATPNISTIKAGKSLGNLSTVGITPIRQTIDNKALMLTTAGAVMGTPRLPMPRSILPRERSAFDKLVDYLVGDGPTNRYALICKQCSSHNGMALREEFDYLSFHCCYCHTFNPARKQRPPAPRLGAERRTPPPIAAIKDVTDSTDTDEKNSPSDSEVSDTKDQIDEGSSEAETGNVTTTKGELMMESAGADQTIRHEGKEEIGGDRMEIDESSSQSLGVKQDEQEVETSQNLNEVKQVD